ncbi:Neither inactivation nor afterpotential protein C [Frankliniella fusca]|uniref:Neither inactivation nor afterpotential protein C n=1 Tax=Frankliniella fusca TaxID=407009 RepID=A0AAE1GTS1_9NEOP|nr:Neither inactivation nor afterpotential protein C [Frankliniella fusca]
MDRNLHLVRRHVTQNSGTSHISSLGEPRPTTAAMAGAGPPASEFSLDALPDPGDRFVLGEVIGQGLFGTVYEAQDTEASNMKVAVKVLQVDEDRLDDAREEYHVLRDLSDHPNLPDFYGAYAKRTDEGDQVWFVMELCANGPVTDLVRGLLDQNKKMNEDHIAYILKCTIKALVHLHERHVMHRDVRGSNILLNAAGEVKLVDYGLSRELDSTMGRKSSCLGSPAWLAPEVVACSNTHQDHSEGYDNKCDVWSIGITAIELGDGKAPLQDMHPTRALFQILTNPPPALYRPANWTQLYNDFITECLEKNPENRPFMPELMEHPFITALPENDDHFQTELKVIAETASAAIRDRRYDEVIVRHGFIQKDQSNAVETMVVEDLAAMEVLTEDTIARELEERYRRGCYHTFVGDVLLVINPNADIANMYGKARQSKYQFKSRSDNEPHVYAVADSAYQDVFHNEEPQRIILAGESMSGKTTNFKHMLTHLLFLGKSGNGCGERVEKAVSIIQALGNAATPLNPSSTRHVHHLEVTYTATGRASGAIIWLYQLEKWRVTTECQKGNANFHVFYYFYDAMAASSSLERYLLEPGSSYRYLRAGGETCSDKDPRNTQEANVAKYEKLRQFLVDLEFSEEERECLWKTLAAILILGEVTFVETDDNFAEVENPDTANKVAQLLSVDEKKFVWALTNYCVVQGGTAVRRRHTREEAVQARDVMARALYARLVDWVVNTLNYKLSYNRAIFGDKHVVSLTDMFGFENHQRNTLETLLINTLNEQMTYHYGQRTFAWEMQEQEEEEIPLQPLQYYNNKGTVDELMLKPDGLLYLLDEAKSLRNEPRGPRISAGDTTFVVAHYTGKVTYDVRAMAAKNRDFLPPEMTETLRQSNDANIKLMFTNQLSKSGNLTAPSPPGGVSRPSKEGPKKTRWGAALVAETGKCRHYNTQSRGQYSQTRRMRTAAATFRGACLEVLRALAFGPGCGGTHFVRCVRANSNNQARVFQQDTVRTQLRALAVLDTARARQKGYSTRVPFEEFLRRYQFLAFDFDESVDITKDNCRLLLIRLKMEGWVLGKTKVFLKYYHEEYLSRLYEQQVKKIIKVQCMMRAFLAKRNMQTKLKRLKSQDSGNRESFDLG